jgi:hypothetical protein
VDYYSCWTWRGANWLFDGARDLFGLGPPVGIWVGRHCAPPAWRILFDCFVSGIFDHCWSCLHRHFVVIFYLGVRDVSAHAPDVHPVFVALHIARDPKHNIDEATKGLPNDAANAFPYRVHISS